MAFKRSRCLDVIPMMITASMRKSPVDIVAILERSNDMMVVRGSQPSCSSCL